VNDMSIEKQGVRGIALGSGIILRVRSLQLVVLAFAKVGIKGRAQLLLDHVVVVIESGGGSASGNDCRHRTRFGWCCSHGPAAAGSPWFRTPRQSGAATVIRPALFGLALN
jgi:hypothetical protein